MRLSKNGCDLSLRLDLFYPCRVWIDMVFCLGDAMGRPIPASVASSIAVSPEFYA